MLSGHQTFQIGGCEGDRRGACRRRIILPLLQKRSIIHLDADKKLKRGVRNDKEPLLAALMPGGALCIRLFQLLDLYDLIIPGRNSESGDQSSGARKHDAVPLHRPRQFPVIEPPQEGLLIVLADRGITETGQIQGRQLGMVKLGAFELVPVAVQKDSPFPGEQHHPVLLFPFRVERCRNIRIIVRDVNGLSGSLRFIVPAHKGKLDGLGARRGRLAKA